MSGEDFDGQVEAGDMPDPELVSSHSPEKNGLDGEILVAGGEVGIGVEGEFGIGGGGEIGGEGEVVYVGEGETGIGGEGEDGIGGDGEVGIGGDGGVGVTGGVDVAVGGDGGGKRWPGWPGENVFRMLVPAQKVGGIIGRKGEFIKKLTEETRARIKILDGPPGTSERAVMVSAKEEPDVTIPPAMDGLLRVHKRIIDVDNDSAHAASGAGGKVITRLLLADTQAGSLIGKHGATIKTIQDTSGCIIRVLGSEHLPLFALPDDSIVEIQGEPAGVHKGVELIAAQLRKFLVDRSVIGIFETQMQNPNARANQNMPPPQSWGSPHPPQGFSMNAGGGPGFGPNSQYMPPSRQYDNYYSPADLPPMEKQHRQGPPPYGRDPSLGIHHSSMPPQQSLVAKVTQHMQIPLAYADAVIGTSGANISYIRRTSGATIAIQETRGVPGEMTVEISGSASQIQTAQQLIQNFIAEAASAALNNPPGGSMNQGYNSYPGHGPMYGSPPRSAGGHADHPPASDYSHAGEYGHHVPGAEYGHGGHAPGTEYGHTPAGGDYGHAPAGDYGPVYGNNYGY